MTFRVVLELAESTPAGLPVGWVPRASVSERPPPGWGPVCDGPSSALQVTLSLWGQAGKSLVHLALFGEREIALCPGGQKGV